MRQTATAEERATTPASPDATPSAIPLDEHGLAWLVEDDEVDVVAMHVRADGLPLARRVIGTARPGDVLLGARFATAEGHVALSGVARGGARVRRLSLYGMRLAGLAPGAASDLVAALDRWFSLMGRAAAAPASNSRVNYLEPGSTLTLEPGATGVPRAAVSIRVDEGCCSVSGFNDLTLRPESGTVPLPASLWLTGLVSTRITCGDFASALRADEDWRGVRELHRVCLGAWLRGEQAEVVAERQRVRDRMASDARVVDDAVRGLSAVLSPEVARRADADEGITPLVAALVVAAESIGVAARPSSLRADGLPPGEALESLARQLRIRVRRVALRGVWWRRATGAMIAILQDDAGVVALVPRNDGGYDAVNTAAGTRARVTAEHAESLPMFARLLYRPLPDRALGVRDTMAFALRECRGDLRRLIIFGLAGSAVGTLVPLAMAQLVDEVIPAGDRAQLWLLLVGLVAAALSGAVFNFTSTIAVLRMQGRMDSTVQSAVWSRLLDLPVRFFRQFSAADLASRAMSISAMRQTLTDASVAGLLGALFAVLSVVILMAYSFALALFALALVAAMAAATFGLGALQVRYQRQLLAMDGLIDGVVFHLLGGIAKLRVARAEGRAFAQWSRLFAQEKSLALRSRVAGGWLDAFTSTFSVLATTAVLVGVASMAKDRLSPGAAIAFLAAFASLMSAAVLVSDSMVSLLRIVPLYERAAPILLAVPEIARSKAPPGTLTGAMQVRRLRFRYRAGGPQALDDVSFNVPAGSFVAIVGPSGSGKSTLFRLLLGFDEPEEGGVFYDGRSLAELDVQLVRRQVGTVLQQGRLFTGDIFRNIVGSLTLTVSDAWEAARRAGVAEDIEAMPMKMYTVISEGGGNISGGQRQRILIARALAANPRILLFDEATSALDNRTQAIVSESVDAMRITRLVIAHRLSTVRNADVILVLDGGRLVEQGSYEELMTRNGVFARLAARQMA